MRLDSGEAAYRAALVLLSARDRTRVELSRLLVSKGFTQAASETALDRLRGQGFLDDRRFADAWARSRLRAKPMGSHRLRQELQAKGVEEELVSEVLKEIYEMGEEEAARRAMAGKLSRLRHLSVASRIGRMGRFLQRRGFSADMIWRLVREGRQGRRGTECDG